MTVVTTRRRQGGPKTKTGCQTCKIRRVKCDETKPSCHRCTSTGRKCDGYPSDSLVLSPNYPRSAAIVHRIASHIPGNTQEKRGLQYFITNTAAELTGYYTSSFWEYLILQASVTEPSLRHAVIAIGALHEEFSAERLGCEPPHERAGSGFAISQYSKAISHLRRSLSAGTQAPLTALMSCILFVCFDSLRGHFDSAMVHLQSGLKILKDLRMKGRVKGKGEEHIVEKNITPLFERLSIQAILYIDTRSPGDRKRFARELDMVGEGEEVQVEGAFESLEDARSALNRAAGGLFRMFYVCDGEQPMSSQPPEAFALYNTYSTQLSTWDTSFNAFMSTHSSTFTPRQIRGAALLKIHHTTAQIMCLATPSLTDPRTTSIVMNNAETFNAFTPQFLIILNLSRSLIAAAEQDLKNGKPSLTFSTDLGVVGPLYYLCVKCTVKEIKEQALNLLGRCPRREGMWDSVMGSKLIREFWEIEETHKSFEECRGGGAGTPLSEWVDLVLVDGGRWEWKLKVGEGVGGSGGGVQSFSMGSGMEEDWLTLLQEHEIYNGEYAF